MIVRLPTILKEQISGQNINPSFSQIAKMFLLFIMAVQSIKQFQSDIIPKICHFSSISAPGLFIILISLFLLISNENWPPGYYSCNTIFPTSVMDCLHEKTWPMFPQNSISSQITSSLLSLHHVLQTFQFHDKISIFGVNVFLFLYY